MAAPACEPGVVYDARPADACIRTCNSTGASVQCAACSAPFQLVRDGTSSWCELPAEGIFKTTVEVLLVLIVVLLIGGFLYEVARKVQQVRAKSRPKVQVDDNLDLLTLGSQLGSQLKEQLPELQKQLLPGEEEREKAQRAIAHGALYWHISRLADWSLGPARHAWCSSGEKARFKRYDFLINVHLEDIVGVGLALFYDFHVLPMAMALFLGIAAGNAAYVSDLWRAIHHLEEASSQGSGPDVLKARAEEALEASRTFAYTLWMGLLVVWCLLVLCSFLRGIIDARGVVKKWNEANSTMCDYAVELRGLPHTTVSEEALLKEMTLRFEPCGATPIGVSIGYDLSDPELQGEVASMLERLIIMSDIRFHQTGRHFPVDTVKSRILGAPAETFDAYGEELADPSDWPTEAVVAGERRRFQDISKRLRCCGRAWVVFKYKVDVRKALGMFSGFWEKREVTFQPAEYQKWLNALTPRWTKFRRLDQIWPGGEAIIQHKVILGRKGDQEAHVPKGSLIKDPAALQQRIDRAATAIGPVRRHSPGPGSRRADAEAEEAGDEANTDEAKAEEPEAEKYVVELEQRIAVCEVHSEPVTILWLNLGTNMEMITERTVRATMITFLVFVAIIFFAYLPYSYFVMMPLAKVDASPGPFTSQAWGLLFGIFNNILNGLMCAEAWGVGFWYKWELDVWVLIYNMVVGCWNTAFNMIFYFWHTLGALLENYVHLLDDATYDGSKDILLTALNRESQMSSMTYSMLIPGWLFSGFLIGATTGFITPWLLNSLLLEVMFVVKCLPLQLNQLLSLITPFNPDPSKPLTARMAELIYQAPEVGLAWDYADKVLTPTICTITLFFLSPSMWRIFPWLLAWAAFQYLFHRFWHLHVSKKQLHDSPRLEACVLFCWGLPVSIVAAAWAFWGVRLGYLKSPWMVLASFVASAVIYWIGMLLVVTQATPWHSEPEESHDEVSERLLYNWFNTNAVHVLNCAYGDESWEGRKLRNEYDVPFQYGKEYLVADRITAEREEEHLKKLEDQQRLLEEEGEVETQWLWLQTHRVPLTSLVLFVGSLLFCQLIPLNSPFAK